MKYFLNFVEGLFNCNPYTVYIFKKISAIQSLHEIKKNQFKKTLKWFLCFIKVYYPVS